MFVDYSVKLGKSAEWVSRAEKRIKAKMEPLLSQAEVSGFLERQEIPPRTCNSQACYVTNFRMEKKQNYRQAFFFTKKLPKFLFIISCIVLRNTSVKLAWKCGF